MTEVWIFFNTVIDIIIIIIVIIISITTSFLRRLPS